MKSGVLTSEFWIAVVVLCAATILCAVDKIDATAWAAAVATASGGYQLARGLAKVNPPKDSDPVGD